MNAQQIYMTVFWSGFLFCVISFLAGSLRFPHFHVHGHTHHGGFGKIAGKGGRGGVSPFNLQCIAAFLIWFGGTGYLLERYSGIWAWLVTIISVMSGLGGASVIFWFLWKLAASDRPLDPADYDMIGVLGRVASPIRPGGTGELIYSRHGSRCATAARSENGDSILRDTEVVVTRFEKGIAYVRPWDEMHGEKF